jgi:hypothetical protein
MDLYPARRRPEPHRAPRPSSRSPQPRGLLTLQRSAGNAAVARLLAGEERSPALDVIGRGGQPLASGVRTDMERRLGHEFSDVRIHTDRKAHVAARSIAADAFTSGRDIAFAAGRYAPSTPAGRQMLAHELTHVVQQRAGAVSATPVGGGIALSDPSDRFERAAEASAARATESPVAVQGWRRSTRAAPCLDGGPSAAKRSAGAEIVQRLLTRGELAEIAFEERKAIKILFWTHEMSPRYGAVLDRLDEYHRLIGELPAGERRAEVDAALERVRQAVKTYLDAHTGEKEQRLAGLVTLEADIVQERAAIDSVRDDEESELTWAEAIESKRRESERAATSAAPAAWRQSVAPRGKRPARPVKDLKPAGRPLAKGGFGAIYQAGGSDNAIIKKSLEDRRQQSFTSELNRQAKVPHHPNVMKVLGKTADEAGVLKYIRGGTLKSALKGLRRAYQRKKIDSRLYAGVQQRFAADIFAGLAHLHARGVVHADIHAGNVVLGHIHGRAKLIDYAAVKSGARVNIGHYYGGFAPEAAALYPKCYTTSVGKFGQQRYTPKQFTDIGAEATLAIHKAGGAQALDVFRAGLLVTEQLEDLNPREIRALGSFWALASSFTREYSKMPQQRPTAAELLAHRYLQPESMLIDQEEYEQALKIAGVKLTARKPRGS